MYYCSRDIEFFLRVTFYGAPCIKHPSCARRG